MKPCNCTDPSSCHRPQDHGGPPKRRKPIPPRTPPEEWAYSAGMCVYVHSRGYRELAASYALQAADWLETIQRSRA